MEYGARNYFCRTVELDRALAKREALRTIYFARPLLFAEFTRHVMREEQSNPNPQNSEVQFGRGIRTW